MYQPKHGDRADAAALSFTIDGKSLKTWATFHTLVTTCHPKQSNITQNVLELSMAVFELMCFKRRLNRHKKGYIQSCHAPSVSLHLKNQDNILLIP